MSFELLWLKNKPSLLTRNQLLSIFSLDLYEFDLYEGILERIIRINRGMSVVVLVGFAYIETFDP